MLDRYYNEWSITHIIIIVLLLSILGVASATLYKLNINKSYYNNLEDAYCTAETINVNVCPKCEYSYDPNNPSKPIFYPCPVCSNYSWKI